MTDLWKKLLGLGDKAYNIADEVSNSDEVNTIRTKATQAYEIIGEKANDLITRATNPKQKTEYGKVAKACEDVNDALLQEQDGTSAKIINIAAGKLGAIGTSAGVFGVAATVGTASTGTAIGALSGAAATSATLAWVGGSVVIGTAIVGALAVAGGVGFAAGAAWFLQKYWRGKKRLQSELSDREQKISEVTCKLAIACKRMDSEGNEPDPKIAKVIFEETLLPLCKELMEQEELISEWPQGAKIKLISAVSNLNDVAMRLQYAGRKSPTISISIFATVITQLMQGDLADLTDNQELVLEALRRSRNDLAEASDEELIAYVNGLSDVQLDGMINNVKGIYHELIFVAAENSDGDIYSASLFEATNYPGADVILTNELTGESQSIQLKATQYKSYIQEHQERYSEFQVFATEEVAGGDISSSGFTNEQITEDTEIAIDTLRNSDGVIDDAMATSAIIALAYHLGRVIKSKDISKVEARKVTVEIAKTAFFSGLAAWVIQ